MSPPISALNGDDCQPLKIMKPLQNGKFTMHLEDTRLTVHFHRWIDGCVVIEELNMSGETEQMLSLYITCNSNSPLICHQTLKWRHCRLFPAWQFQNFFICRTKCENYRRIRVIAITMSQSSKKRSTSMCGVEGPRLSTSLPKVNTIKYLLNYLQRTRPLCRRMIWLSPPFRQQIVSLSQSSCVSPIELAYGRGRYGVGEGAKS